MKWEFQRVNSALRSECQTIWAPCLACYYWAWMYWKAFKLTPLDKEQKEALVVFFTSKSKKRFTKGRIKKKKKWGGNSQAHIPNRKQPSKENGRRKCNFSEITQQGNAWIHKSRVSNCSPLLEIVLSRNLNDSLNDSHIPSLHSKRI